MCEIEKELVHSLLGVGHFILPTLAVAGLRRCKTKVSNVGNLTIMFAKVADRCGWHLCTKQKQTQYELYHYLDGAKDTDRCERFKKSNKRSEMLLQVEVTSHWCNC